MKWYAASAIMYNKFKDGNQDFFPIWENVILISANSFDEALKKAEKRALQDEGDSHGTLEYNGRQAYMTFAGIRKVIECECNDSEEGPIDGTEITYSHLIVRDAKDFDKLINGDSVIVQYEE